MPKQERLDTTDQLSIILRVIQKLRTETEAISPDQRKEIIGSGALDKISAEVEQLRANIVSSLAGPNVAVKPEATIELSPDSKLHFIQCDDLSKPDVPTLRRMADCLFSLYLKARTKADRLSLLRDIQIIKVEIFKGRKQPGWKEPDVTTVLPPPIGMSYTSAYRSFVSSLESDSQVDTSDINLYELDFNQYHVPAYIQKDKLRIDKSLSGFRITDGSTDLLSQLRKGSPEMINKEIDSYTRKFQESFQEIYALRDSYREPIKRLISILEWQMTQINNRELEIDMGTHTWKVAVTDSAYRVLKSRIIDALLIPALAKLRPFDPSISKQQP